MTEFDTPQPGTPAYLADGSTTPQPVIETVVASSDKNSSETEKLKVLLLNDPSNYSAWSSLIKITEATDKIDDINKVYDDCLKIFPEDDTLWAKYAEYHLNKENRSKVEEIFKCCINMKSLKLWNLYLNKFVVKYNNLISGGRQALGNIIKAHEFALVDVGLDLDADTLYDNELQIVSSFSAINEDQNAEKRKITLQILRKAIKAPTRKIQSYWNQYIETCPKNEIQQNSADYLKVKTFVAQLTNCITGLDRDFNQLEKKVDSQILRQLSIYQNWIQFEKANKMELPADLLRKRVEYVYILALRSLRFIPELWIEYSQYKAAGPHLATEKGNLLLQILLKGFAGNATSFAIAYAIAEQYELDNQTAEATQTYENLITSLTKVYELNNLAISKLNEQQQEELKRKDAALKAKRKLEMENNNNDEDEEDEEKNHVPDPLVSRITDVRSDYHFTSQLEKLDKENERIGTAITLAYCAYTRFIRRTSGLKESRNMFKRAKGFPGHSYHIYTTSAEIEQDTSNNKVATKVYELAMRKPKFLKNINFVLEYLSYLLKINDKINAKALFETSVKNFENDEDNLKKLYCEYIKAENATQEDLSTVKFLENRFLKRFPDVKSITVMEERFKAKDYDPIKEFDYFGGYDKYMKGSNMNGSSSKKRKIDESSIENLVDQMDIDDAEDVSDEEPISNEPFVQDEIYNLLRILPKASYCQPSMFDEKHVVAFLINLDK